MVLGWKGPRSTGMRITAGAALAAMVMGPLRMAYAIPVPAVTPQQTAASARQSAGGSRSAPSLSPAPSPPPASSANLPTDVPWALATAVRPARIKVLGGAADEAEVWQLFDGRAAT